MSFTSDVKLELCEIKASTCCKNAECYGILLFGRAFSADLISVSTESEDVANRIITLLKHCFGVTPHIYGGGVTKDTFTLSIDKKEDCENILRALGYYGFKKGEKIIKIQNLEDECCLKAFIRGAFLSCGMVSDPNKDYHAEFSVHNNNLASEFFDLLKENNLHPSITKRGNNSIIYFKESGYIEDLLTTVNATNHTLKLAGIKVYKDMRNYYNRLNNCETANITKTVNAAIRERDAILKLINAGEFEKLSAELKSAAELRKNNPEASLSELCSLSGGNITRSGLNHRLKRLVTLADNLNSR